jgi:hypothetical protein
MDAVRAFAEAFLSARSPRIDAVRALGRHAHARRELLFSNPSKEDRAWPA